MSAAWLRLDLRRRWRSLLVLALLVAFAAGTVMTAVAGARRGESAVDRLLERTLPATVIVLPNTPGFDWDPVRELPGVEALSVMWLAGVDVVGVPPEAMAAQLPPMYDDAAMRTIERPVVLAGRVPDPARADEAVVTPAWTDHWGHGVGDTLTIRMHTPEAVDAYARGAQPAAATGPELTVSVVGVVRSAWFGDEPGSTGGIVFSPGLLSEYPRNLLGTENLVRTNALVRLDDDAGAVPRFRAALAAATGRSDIDVWDMEEQFGSHQRDVTGFEADGLRLFALVAAVVAVVLIGQSVARLTASTVTDLQVLRALGMGPGQARRAAVAGPALAATAGAVIAAAAAVVASRWFPIGTAARAEPTPGIDVDGLVLLLGLLAAPVLVVLGALAAATVALRASARPAQARRSAIAAVAARAGLPVAVVVGTRFALEPGRGRASLPVRPALLGSAVGVLGVLAAFTFSSGVDDAAANPERVGVVHDLELFVGQHDAELVPARDLLDAVAAVPGVAGVNDTRSAVAAAGDGDGQLAVLSIDPIGEPLPFVVSQGRLPATAGEVVIGPASARGLRLGVGDTVELTGTAGSMRLAVVGIALMPQLAHNVYTDGGLVTAATYDELFDGFRFRAGFVALEPGADPDSVVPGLLAVAATFPGGDQVFVAPPELPPEITELQHIRALPTALAAFLAVLALGAVGHALATAVRRRRHELAVLRALGLTRGQCRGVVMTQATVLALAGLAAGIPLGVALGRTVWRYVAETTPVFYVAPMALTAVLLLIPAALVAAALLAAWPSRRAASMRVGTVLRAE
ncbi:ABC transporter permease [Jiangella gansuensis]|uniref:ABC transporter permease n=1 Tax=Jiangella gansuensis TaxID=281473 RepID=UPI00047A81FF|nr:FtsX-like permease family protein [Jiangella gansuensis]